MILNRVILKYLSKNKGYLVHMYPA